MKTILLHETKPERFEKQSLMDRYISKVSPGWIPVVEVFRTVEGEGTFIGTPRVLARVGGCAVGCAWCDTRYTWSLKGSKIMSIDDFVEHIVNVATESTNTALKAAGSVREISITGGEPMHYPVQMIDVSRQLRSRGYATSIETSGVIIAHQVFNEFTFVSLDVKTPSARVPLSANIIGGIIDTCYQHRGAQLKAVISNYDDLIWLESFFKELLVPTDPHLRPLCLTPCADNTKGPVPATKLGEITQMILDWNRGYNIRVISQQHKLLGYS